MPSQQPHPRSAWPSTDDQTLFNLIVITIGIGVGSYLVWTTYHGQISAAVMALQHHQILLLDHFTDRFTRADAQMLHANPYRVSLQDLYGISHDIGQFWRIPGCIFIALLAVVCAVRAAPSRFKRDFDLEGLAREQARSFQASVAFLGRKLNLISPAEGAPLPTDYALTPDEWIERFGRDARGVFDESRALLSLSQQLGPRWNGPEAASPVVRVLFVAFAFHLSERREDAVELLGAVSSSLALVARQPTHLAAPLPLPGDAIAYVTKLLNDPDALGDARRVTAAHAYTAPALMSLLNAARRKHGVLAPAQFAWLKLVDRSLWYALHSLGFETEGIGRYLHPNPRVEALGARDHWAVECMAEAPMIEPDLTRAVRALRRHAGARTAVPWPLHADRYGDQHR